MEKAKKHKSVQYDKWGYFFIAPFFLVYIIFSFIPLVTTFTNSFAEDYMNGLYEEGPHYRIPKYFTGVKKDWASQMESVESKLDALKDQYSKNDALTQDVKDSVNQILSTTAYNLDQEKYTAALDKKLQNKIDLNAVKYIDEVED